ncbi:hypothetical protein BAUCODRAFT_326863 [Baudoinia panamericana UAMH 10762]|uniref:Uncharacterized protein n=1 Tax=Baudoinia panamericana (strain UAMH 10762) TaxID=717646 RepID=M2LBX7_BAUPA|nr:uncharacterized protein BAUCODRAFT_326863 [Baudoinia panamericana UAMH 10762]EMC91402.1 hypothetical protein BAUCODRAFT_326863 [Baudoinia panamericana UAMH 10762]
MCLIKVKEEEDYSVPARVKRVTRVQRYEEPPPRMYERHYVEERRPANYAPPPPRSERAPSTHPPPATSTVAPSTHVGTVRSRGTSRATSVRAPRSHYVEVEDADETSSSSSSSVSEDVRSRATSHRTHKSSRTKATSVAPPASEYSVHEREREIRRERGYSRPREEYETYRYVDAPPGSRRSHSRVGSGSQDARASRDSYRRETKIVIEDDNSRRRLDYRR